LPWQRPEFAPTTEYGYVHVVYVGVADTADLSRLLLRSLFPDRDLSERERQRVTGNGWLAAFVVDELGRPKSDSYLPASFAHGVAALRESNTLDNINARLERAKDEFGQRRHRLVPPRGNKAENKAENKGEDVEHDATVDAALAWSDIEQETRIVYGLLGDTANESSLDWRIVVRSSRVKRRFLDDSLQAAMDFLNSFYLDDLDRLIARAEKPLAFGKALNAYLGTALEERQRIDILTDHTAMTRLVAAARLPCARWPGRPDQPLVLAQQAAVAQIMGSLGGEEGLIGVNGPPGTGKTTLLQDIIAVIVTERARRIAGLERPVALFEEKATVAGKAFFPLKAEVVAGTSIVVTSTNNNAVKNITQELPARKKVADEFEQVDYFADVIREVFRAQKVLDENDQPVDSWGLVAAALGNAGNRRSFAQGFFRDEYVEPHHQRQAKGAPPRDDEEQADDVSPDGETVKVPVEILPPSMKQILEAATNEFHRYQDEWKQAKHAFLALQAEFDRCREVLELAEKAAQRIDEEGGRLDALKTEADALGKDIENRERMLSRQRKSQAEQHAIVGAHQDALKQLRAATRLTLWDRLMAWLGRETPRMAALRHALQMPTRALNEVLSTLAATFQAITVAAAELEERRTRLHGVSTEHASVEKELAPHRQALAAGYAMGVKHSPNVQFWSLPADVRHRASVAVSPKLDRLRAKLFLQAVELHRLTILANAGKFIANLRAVNGMLTGGSRDKLAPEHRPMLWDAFFFVVPVVSTTLASFDRLFIGMEQNSLGWLLIDEAGQATPQSAAGAIWRSKRAVIVGDPLQIEPVFTVPRSLADDLRRRHDVASHWSPIDESVQTLADRITPFGSWVETANGASPGDAPDRLWTGMPLRTHRRCDDPMFTVANRIAYAGQMVQGRVDDAGRPTPWNFSCSLGDSAWLDVRSARVQHPVSEDEIACLMDGLAQLRKEQDGRTKIYVISPFRKVAQACRERVSRARLGGVECGTVHTFQGKEAHVVFLVLGTAPGAAGSGARNWAASKPNLLNVAVTRAQCRLYVIGDASLWGALDYFRELLRELPVRGREMSTEPGTAVGGRGSLSMA
jgi:hypothetical protein